LYGRQQQSDQQADDRNHDEEFNKGKSVAFHGWDWLMVSFAKVVNLLPGSCVGDSRPND